MGADAILSDLTAAGIRLEVRSGTLTAGPRSVLTDEYRDLIRENKLALVALVAPQGGRATSGESPPLAPQSDPAPLAPELVARLRKAATRVLWEAVSYYRDDGADLANLTDDDLLHLVGAYLLRRQIDYINGKCEYANETHNEAPPAWPLS